MAGRLRLDDHHLAGVERAGPGAAFGGWLVHTLDLEETRHREDASLAELLLDELAKLVEDLSDLLAGKLRRFGKRLIRLRLGDRLGSAGFVLGHVAPRD